MPNFCCKGTARSGNVRLGAKLPHLWALLCCGTEGGWEMLLLGRGAAVCGRAVFWGVSVGDSWRALTWVWVCCQLRAHPSGLL